MHKMEMHYNLHNDDIGRMTKDVVSAAAIQQDRLGTIQYVQKIPEGLCDIDVDLYAPT